MKFHSKMTHTKVNRTLRRVMTRPDAHLVFYSGSLLVVRSEHQRMRRDT